VEFERLLRIASEVAGKPTTKSQPAIEPGKGNYLKDVAQLQRDLTKILAKLTAAVESGNKVQYRKIMDEYAKRIEDHQKAWPGDDWGYESSI
jgi:hypothetical protein